MENDEIPLLMTILMILQKTANFVTFFKHFSKCTKTDQNFDKAVILISEGVRMRAQLCLKALDLYNLQTITPIFTGEHC